MNYQHPRFQTQGSSYQTTGSGFSGQGAVSSSGTEQLTNPLFEEQRAAHFQAREQGVAQQGYGQAGPTGVVHPRFQQAWSPQTHVPNVQTMPPEARERIGGFEGYPGQAEWMSTPRVEPPAWGSTPWTQANVQTPPIHAPRFQSPANRGPTARTPNVGTPNVGTPETGIPTQQFGLGRFQGGPGTSQPTIRQPAVDVFDQGETLVFEIELPGVSKDEVELVCNDNSLSLKATAEPSHEQENLVQSERGTIEYERFIPLDLAVVPGEIEASFEDGVLTVTAPKKEPTSGLHKVNIN